MALATTPGTLGGRVASTVVSGATAFVLLGVSIAPFFTPQWIHGEQDRAAAYVPGYSAADVREATDETVRQLFVGADFTFMIDGSNFFDDREVAHMDDVRGVFAGLALIIAASLVIVIGAFGLTRGAQRRAWLWRAVARGATGLAGLMVVVGVVSVVAFDAAFQVFHELLFPAGSFTFDPRTERLVQLFPDQFWSDTSLALGVVALVLAVAAAVVAGRRARHLERVTLSAAGRAAGIPAVHDGSPA